MPTDGPLAGAFVAALWAIFIVLGVCAARHSEGDGPRWVGYYASWAVGPVFVLMAFYSFLVWL